MDDFATSPDGSRNIEAILAEYHEFVENSKELEVMGHRSI
jgi:hypothetical protein